MCPIHTISTKPPCIFVWRSSTEGSWCPSCSWHWRQHLYMADRNIPFTQRRGVNICITNNGWTLRRVPLGDIIFHTDLRMETVKNIRLFRGFVESTKVDKEKNLVIRQHHAAVGWDPFLQKSSLGGNPLKSTYGVECGLKTSPMTMTL